MLVGVYWSDSVVKSCATCRFSNFEKDSNLCFCTASEKSITASCKRVRAPKGRGCTLHNELVVNSFTSADLPDDDMECGGELGQHFGAENSDPNMMAEAAALPKSRIPGMKEKPSIGEGDGGKMVEANKSRKRQRAN